MDRPVHDAGRESRHGGGRVDPEVPGDGRQSRVRHRGRAGKDRERLRGAEAHRRRPRAVRGLSGRQHADRESERNADGKHE